MYRPFPRLRLAVLTLLGSVSMLCLAAAPALAQTGGAAGVVRHVQYVFVVDDSASMRDRTTSSGNSYTGSDQDRLAIFAVQAMVSMLDDSELATVMPMNEPQLAEPIRPLGQSHRAALQGLLDGRLAEYDFQQGTFCDRALEAAAARLNESDNKNQAQVLFFLTDGACTEGHEPSNDWLSRVDSHQRGDFQFYLLAFSNVADSKLRGLKQFTDATNGDVLKVEVDEPAGILRPFGEALSRSQGYKSKVIEASDKQLPSWTGASRVRLLAVAEDQGTPLSFSATTMRQGPSAGAPVVLGATEGGRHFHEDGGQRAFRYAFAEYKPGDRNVEVTVEGGGDRWKVLALPEWRLGMQLEVTGGECASTGGAGGVTSLRMRQQGCVRVRVFNEDGDVTAALADQGLVPTLEHRLLVPGETRFKVLGSPTFNPSGTLEFVAREEGTHELRAALRLVADGSDLPPQRSPASTIEVIDLNVQMEPEMLRFSDPLRAGGKVQTTVRFTGNFPPLKGTLRLSEAQKASLPDCVALSFSGGEATVERDLAVTADATAGEWCGGNARNELLKGSVGMELVTPSDQIISLSPRFEIPFDYNPVLPPKSIQIEVDGGEEGSVPLAFGARRAQPVDWEVHVPERKLGSGELDLGFVDPDRDGERLPFGPSRVDGYREYRRSIAPGSAPVPPMVLAAKASSCCQEGPFRTTLLIMPPGATDSADGHEVDVEVVVRPASMWACWGKRILLALLLLLLLLLAWYCWRIWSNSHFLDRKKVANSLTPLRWSEDGDAKPDTRHSGQVRGRVDLALRFMPRLLNWLKCNPLRMGLPGGEFRESVQVTLLARQPAQGLMLGLLPVRNQATVLSEQQGSSSLPRAGGVWFVATPGGHSIRLVGKPSEDYDGLKVGSLYDMNFLLMSDEPKAVVREVKKRTRLTASEEEPGRPAGWLLE